MGWESVDEALTNLRFPHKGKIMPKLDAIDKMNLELGTLQNLYDAMRRMNNTPVVDDDYPEMRHYYNSALKTFLDALGKNRGNLNPPSIVQPWAADLGLRHQGVLVSAIRGCDGIGREDASKYLVRVYRGALLRPHCDDLEKCASFMIPYDGKMWDAACMDFFSSIDHYPNHWILHFTHAAHIVGLYHDAFICRRKNF
jgi:hypothetical protein